MNKPLCVISCCLDTYSGYGARSRDFCKSLIQLKGNDWDIKILSMRWGNTSFGYLEDHNETDLQSRIIYQMTQQPEYWFQITIPSEFQKIGKLYSVGVTAGIETTVCDMSWIEGCNKMDLVLTSSEHSKQVFEISKFEKREPNQPPQIIELKTKCEVLLEGVDLNVYKTLINDEKTDLSEILDTIPESFCYLFLGTWLQGDQGEDRKNISGLIKTFIEAFRNQTVRPALILKTQGAVASVTDKEEIINKVQRIKNMFPNDNIPNIYLLHGELSDEEINELYNHSKVKAFVSFTKGEGFGRPLLEASLMQKPVIAPGWSGHVDFLKHSILIPGKLEKVHHSALVQNMIIPESQWFNVDYGAASKILKEVYKDYSKKLDLSKKQSYFSKKEFSFDKMTEILSGIIETNFPQYKPFTLPKGISNINLPVLKKI